MAGSKSRAPKAAWGAILALCLAGPAFAEEGDGEVLVVTGVRAQPRSLLDSPAPVDSFSADSLRGAGAVSDELGQALAVTAPSFHFPRQSNSGSSDHVRAGQLRGLSPDQMLVLVNGHRRHTSAIVNSETKIGRGVAAVDFNSIPLSAVRRVEVLRDGAGAQYGSDAIAGVINVILDDDPEAVRVSASYGAHVTHLDPIGADITDGRTTTLDASFGARLGGDGFVRFGFDYEDRASTNRAGFDQIPFFIPQTPDNLALAGQRNYAEGDPNVEDWNLWYNAETRLGALRLYGFGTYGERETRGGATFFRYPDGSDNVREIYPNGFRPQSAGDNRDLSLVGGARFAFAGWDWDASASFGANRFAYGVENSLNASLGPASQTSFKSGAYEFQQNILALDAQRRFASPFAGPVAVAAGVEYRHETYETEAGETASYAAGPFDLAIGAQGAPGLTPADEADIARDVAGVYLDFSADITNRLFANAAARYEHYSDFGGELTGKLSALYRLSESVALRGAISNSFRAPGLAQVGFSDTTLNFGAGRSLVRARTLRVNDPIAEALGAQPLDAETSLNASLGLTASPAPGLSFTIDVFQIDVDDRITLSDRYFGAAFEAFVQALPGGAALQSARFFTNAVDTRTQGVDVVLAYARDAFGGTLSLSGAYAYAETEITSFARTPTALTAIDPSFRLVGVEEVNTIEEAAPRSKLVLTGEWRGERFGALLRVSRYGSAVRVFNFGGGFEPRQRYGGETQVDAEARLALNENVAFALGASNLLDEYPDRSNPEINFFGNLPYDILSPIGVNGRYVYSRLSVSF